MFKCLLTDTETGGLDADIHSVLEIALVGMDLDSGEILSSFGSYVKYPRLEDYVVTEAAFKVHGITPEKAFAEGIPKEDIQNKMLDMYVALGAPILGGHNIPFDREMIAKQIYECSIAEFNANFNHRLIDSCSILRLFEGHNDLKAGASLEKAVKMLNIDMSDIKGRFHGALYDTIAAGRVLCKFRQLMGKLNIK